MNIYIANLSYDVKDNDLKELFEGHGKVDSAKIITDKFSGRSRGFGFVEMANNEEATDAISKLNNTEFHGKMLTVAEAKPKTENKERRFNSGNRNFSDRRNDRY